MAAITSRQPLASAKEVSAHLGVPITTLYTWRSRGKGPKATRVGRHLRYRWADIDAWLAEQR
jgi:excisionase family DNA binding protein